MIWVGLAFMYGLCGYLEIEVCLLNRTALSAENLRIGNRDADKHAAHFGMKRALGSVVNSYHYDRTNPNEESIFTKGLICIKSKGLRFNSERDTMIVAEALTDRGANQMLMSELSSVSMNQHIMTMKKSGTFGTVNGDVYTESEEIIKAPSTEFKHIQRVHCRMENSDVGGIAEYAVAIYPRGTASGKLETISEKEFRNENYDFTTD